MGLYIVTAIAEIKIVFNDENQAISSSNLETIQKIARDYNNNAMELHIEWTEYNFNGEDFPSPRFVIRIEDSVVDYFDETKFLSHNYKEALPHIVDALKEYLKDYDVTITTQYESSSEK